MDTRVLPRGDLVSMTELMARDSSNFAFTHADVEGSSVLAQSPYVAKLITKGYLVVPGPPRPMNLVDLKFRFSRYFDVPERSWYDDLSFAKREILTPLSYLAVRMEPAKNSLDETWEEGVGYIKNKVERVPLAVEILYATIVFLLVRRKSLTKRITLRTASKCSTLFGEEAHAGIFCSLDSGISIMNIRDNVCDKKIGVAAARVITVS